MVPSPYVRRVIDQELDELLASLPAIALDGAKGVGKTATASNRAGSILALDDAVQREIVAADIDRIISAPQPVLVDEWQRLPAVWDRVRRAVDDGASGGAFLLTGSASPQNTGTHSGAGRIVSLRMRPLSLAERAPGSATVSLRELLAGERPPVRGTTKVTLGDYVNEITRSGFPGIRGLPGRAHRLQLDGYLQRIVDRDFPEMDYVVRNPDGLRRWMGAYAAATATTASFETIRDAATAGHGDKPSKRAATPYREILERLFVIDQLPGWLPTRNAIRELAVSPKHHLVDPGLAARLLGASPESLLGQTSGDLATTDGSMLGRLFESLVTLSVRVYAQAGEARVRHLRTHRGLHEVDLIVVRDDGRVLAIEVKLGATPDAAAVRHLDWLATQIGDDLIDRVVITTGPEAYRRADGIAVVPAALLGP